MIIKEEFLYKNLECDILSKSMVVYVVRHIVDGKIYVGKTTRKLRKRIMEHLQNCRISYFDRAIRKYGLENFDISILEECETIDELNECEKFWIRELNCKIPNGYNLTDGGEGIVGYHVPPELCQKRSENRKGFKVSQKTCMKISMAKKGKKGKPASQQTREKMSAANKNKRAVICVETKQIFPSIKSAANSVKLAACTISRVLDKKNYTAGGYHWEYLSKETPVQLLELAGNDMQKNKFGKIYSDLKTKIETQEFEFNSFIPSENTLTKVYDCSRSTVRRAIAELIHRGYVQVRQGSRVRVIYEPVERNVFKIGGIESFKEAAARNGFSYDTKVVRLEKIIADAEISARTGFKVGDELYDVRRVRYIEGKALILDKNYFLTSVVTELTEEIAKKSIYEYLENTLKVKIMTSKRKMTTELATSEDKEYLELADYNCLAIVSGRVFNDAGIQFEYTESRHRPDYFCFEDTATRRKKNAH